MNLTYLTGYHSNPSMGQTGPDSQNILSHRELLIKDLVLNNNNTCTKY